VGDHVLGISENSPETIGYWEGVDQDELRLKRCSDCGQHLHPRRIICPNCASANLDWSRVSGRGRVYTFSQVFRAPRRELAPSLPYFVGIVELEEGVCLFTRLIPDQDADVRIGAAVEVAFRELEVGGKLPVFQVRAS
jgi:uncharacterized OB-fold protein